VHEEIGWDTGRLGPDIRIWRLRNPGEGSACHERGPPRLTVAMRDLRRCTTMRYP